MAEVQDVFLSSFDEYGRGHFVPLQAGKVAKAIMGCRTSQLGGHLDVCDCGYEHPSYNSCRNRHCPKCQTVRKEQWVGKRRDEMLDERHLHTVFTIPAELNALVLQNQRMLYDLLFSASAQTVKELAADPGYLGATPGFTSILHTWGSNMSFHPHIHMVLTSGGLTDDGRWKGGGEFLFPVRVLSRLFRGKFIAGCRRLYDKRKIELRGENGNKVSHKAFSALLDDCMSKEWVVYSKAPFNGAEGVFEYLGRYTHRSVISNNRIVSVEDGLTTFMWKDYRDESRLKPTTLKSVEFIRRFLLHVLPHGFTRIRHYGLYASRDKGRRLDLCRAALVASGRRRRRDRKSKPAESPFEIVVRILGRDPGLCPRCGRPLAQLPLSRAAPA